jgi:hypothetical protein
MWRTAQPVHGVLQDRESVEVDHLDLLAMLRWKKTSPA